LTLIDDRPLGQLFSLTYREPDEPAEDHERLRRRLALALFEAAGGYRTHSSATLLSKRIERRFGIPAPHNKVEAEYDFGWVRFFNGLTREDLLDIITVAATSPELVQRGTSKALIGEIERIFRETNAPYEIDALGGVHPRRDLAFSIQRASVVQGLDGPEYAPAREYVDECVKALRQSLPDGAEAIRDVFLAIENVFRQMFPDQQRLTSGGVSARLRPFIEEIFPDGEVERAPYLQAASSFGCWIQASNGYRHEQPQPTVNQPPEELYTLLVTQGFSFLRWLTRLRKTQRDRQGSSVRA
jgi:hypothetical protein